MAQRILESGRFGRCTERGVSAFERRVAQKLPADYRGFLLEHNGGKPEAALDDTKGAGSIVRQLHGLHRGPSWARLESLRKTYAGRMPAGLLPIGSDPFGNVYCLGLRGRWRGKVWFWDHENEADEGEAPRTDNLKLVARSFASFLAKLRRAPPEPPLPRTRTLGEAIAQGDLAAVDRLLSAGKNPNQRFPGGHTHLMTAATFGHVEIVKRLLAAGADVHAREKYGHTAAVLASWSDQLDVMRELMKAGARPETPHLEHLFAKWSKKRSKPRR